MEECRLSLLLIDTSITLEKVDSFDKLGCGTWPNFKTFVANSQSLRNESLDVYSIHLQEHEGSFADPAYPALFS